MSETLKRLIHDLAKLPGIGERTATRLAFFILRQPKEYADSLSRSISDIKVKLSLCSKCQNLTESDPCALCLDARRDSHSICVVEEPNDMMAIEKTHSYRGTYHVLHGAISPLDGIGPDQIKASELIKRIGVESISEVILATNADVEGETTALYLNKLIKPIGVKVTRLASGIPVGGELEYVDSSTLSRALESRKEF